MGSLKTRENEMKKLIGWSIVSLLFISVLTWSLVLVVSMIGTVAMAYGKYPGTIATFTLTSFSANEFRLMWIYVIAGFILLLKFSHNLPRESEEKISNKSISFGNLEHSRFYPGINRDRIRGD